MRGSPAPSWATDVLDRIDRFYWRDPMPRNGKKKKRKPRY